MERADAREVGQADYSAHAGEYSAEDGADSVSAVGRGSGAEQRQRKALSTSAEPEQHGIPGDHGCSAAGTDDYRRDGMVLATQVRIALNQEHDCLWRSVTIDAS